MRRRFIRGDQSTPAPAKRRFVIETPEHIAETKPHPAIAIALKAHADEGIGAVEQGARENYAAIDEQPPVDLREQIKRHL